jgi:hypothetical protein
MPLGQLVKVQQLSLISICIGRGPGASGTHHLSDHSGRCVDRGTSYQGHGGSKNPFSVIRGPRVDRDLSVRSQLAIGTDEQSMSRL